MGRRLVLIAAVACVGGAGCPSPAGPGAGTGVAGVGGGAAAGSPVATGGRSAAAPPSADAAAPTARSGSPVPIVGFGRKRAMWATWPMPNPPAMGLPNPGSYVISKMGIVRDTVTGLLWQRSVDSRTYSWVQAGEACARLDLAGYHDWRLPSRIELVSIVDPTRSQPSIERRAFPDTPVDWFWTSSVNPVNPDGAAWSVDFRGGAPKSDNPTNNVFRIRCVRTPGPREPREPSDAGAPREPKQRDRTPQLAWSAPLYDVQQETVVDRGTGLEWQRGVPTQTFSFSQARQYCGKLRVGERGGWRVPTLGELLSLVDERSTNPTIDVKAFPKPPGGSFWTSSPLAANPSMAWHVDFEYGNGLQGLVKGPHHVRCVR